MSGGALDTCIRYARVSDETKQGAVAELAQLRSRLAQLEAERDELKNIIATRDEIIAGLLKPKRSALAQGRG